VVLQAVINAEAVRIAKTLLKQEDKRIIVRAFLKGNYSKNNFIQQSKTRRTNDKESAFQNLNSQSMLTVELIG
jgi:hypothetical protein